MSEVASPVAAAVAPAPVVEVVPVVAAPAVAEVAAAPAPVADPAPVVEAPKVDAAPAADAPKAEVAPAPAADAVKPDAPAADAPNVEAEAEAAPAPTYEFKVPETVTMDAAQISAYSNVLGKYNIPQEAGQELMEFGANLLKSQSEAAAQKAQDDFAATRAGWVQEFEKMAGNRRDTLLNDAKFAITDTIKDTKERAALWQALGATGAGDNPLVIKAFAKIGARLRERSAPPPDAPDKGARGGTAADRRYGGQKQT